MAGPPAIVTRVDRMGAQIFEQAADEIAHLDQRVFGQADGRRLTAPSEVSPVAAAIWASHRLGRHRRRYGSNGSRPNRKKARRRRSCRGSTGLQRCRAGRWPCVLRSFHRRARRSQRPRQARRRAARRPPRDCADHRAGRRIDRRLARRQRQTGLGHSPDARSRPETRRPGLAVRSARPRDQCAMRHVGIVARILDDRRRGRNRAELLHRQRELGPQPLRQRHLDGIREFATSSAPRKRRSSRRWRSSRSSNRVAAALPIEHRSCARLDRRGGFAQTHFASGRGVMDLTARNALTRAHDASGIRAGLRWGPAVVLDLARRRAVKLACSWPRAISSAVEHSLHTGGVAGSIPASPTIQSRQTGAVSGE